jgi:bifunctional enzyme CysN/CysC
VRTDAVVSGAPLLAHLENVNIVASDRNLIDLRFPVQYVLRPNLNFRGYCGTIASGWSAWATR